MKLKCIGGPNDNEYHDVFDYLKNGDCISIKEKQELSLCNNLNSIPDSISVKFEIYKLAVIFLDNQISYKFLIHSSMTFGEAIKYQFKKAIHEKHIHTVKSLITDFGSHYRKEKRIEIIKLGEYLGIHESDLPIKGI